MPLDHLGINVPDAAAARAYDDALMPLVGFEPFFAGEGRFSYAPAAGHGTQLFFYTAEETMPHSRHRPGLQHLCFRVLHDPRTFPEYHADHYATYWIDPHGFKLEVVSFEHLA
jgi:catechol 2,3-dioxygenase-like lactoylglutathione lyase family enzyme